MQRSKEGPRSKVGRAQFKSLWKGRAYSNWNFICPFCRANRRVPFHPIPGSLRQIFQIFICSSFFALLFWNMFSWKGLLSFFPFWAVYEAIYRWRVRARMSCPQCGFDPYLYSIDRDWALEEIDLFWRKKFELKGIPYPETNKKKSELDSRL